MSSLFLILLCCIGSWIMYLWFYSDFFAYYIKCFKFLIPQKLNKLLMIEEFLNSSEPYISYISFIYEKKAFTKSFFCKFFLKLLGCITCLTTWFAIIISLIYGNILYVGLVFVILRILDFILRYTNK